MADIELIYKITLLHLLKKAKEPISNERITEFFQSFNYTGYFKVQRIINNLIDTKMIEKKSSHNITKYNITPLGLETSRLFKEKITPGISKDINTFLLENAIKINEDNSIKAIYDTTEDGNYIVNLSYEKELLPIINMSLKVESAEIAETICNNWKERYMEMYLMIKENLLE